MVQRLPYWRFLPWWYSEKHYFGLFHFLSPPEKRYILFMFNSLYGVGTKTWLPIISVKGWIATFSGSPEALKSIGSKSNSDLSWFAWWRSISVYNSNHWFHSQRKPTLCPLLSECMSGCISILSHGRLGHPQTCTGMSHQVNLGTVNNKYFTSTNTR